MSRDREAKPRSELEVVRIGGGASARLVALVMVMVASTFSWIAPFVHAPRCETRRSS